MTFYEGAGNRGYTLIELLVVLLLLGTILFMAAPRLRDIIAGDPLDLAARRLSALGRELRSQAVRDQLDYHLSLDLDQQRFFAYREDTGPEGLAIKREKALSLGEGVRFAKVDAFLSEQIFFGEAIIRFSKEGYAQPALIYLESGSGKMTLLINPILPAIKIWDGHAGRVEATGRASYAN